MPAVPPEPEPEPEPDEIVRYGSLPDQVADLWRPAGTGRPLIVLIHGGFWRARYDRLHLRPMAAALRAQGWPVAAIEYRRLTGDPDAATGDVRQALMMLLHGTEDADVPLGMSRSYVRAHPAARLIVLPDTGHFALIDPASKAWPRVVTELEGPLFRTDRGVSPSSPATPAWKKPAT